ncbi:MAG TPA: amino acid ABC transporter permease [Firmicutes bacterium]|nr:amino acid ABC transporter permease [Bacillota bacterium]
MFWQVTLSLLEGFGTTCLIFIVTLAASLVLGLLIAFGTMSRYKWLRAILKTLIWIIRGTPLMLQVMVIFYVPGLLFHVNLFTRLTAVFVAFIINYSCYFSEIYRGGIQSISRGQYEAGQVLGMTRAQIFFRVVLVQVIKRIIPPMSNEVMTLVKDTSLARVILVEEIIKNAEDFVMRGLVWPLFYSAVFYLVFVGILTLAFRFVEKRLAYFKV